MSTKLERHTLLPWALWPCCLRLSLRISGCRDKSALMPRYSTKSELLAMTGFCCCLSEFCIVAAL